MKKQAGIWIDSSKAIIVTLSEGNEHIMEIASDVENLMRYDKQGDKGVFMGNHHINNEKTFEERKKHLINAFLKNVVEQIKGNDELYVFGPSETKLRLQNFIENTSHLFGNLKSIETADRMTPNQVVAKVKDFYGYNSSHSI